MKLKVSLKFSSEKVIPVGILHQKGRDCVFEYDSSFLSIGLNPSPFRLPVKSGVNVFDWSGGMETFGMFEDSLPDGWGRRIVNTAFKKRHGRLPAILERLACVGTSGMGALIYEPEDNVQCENAEFDLVKIAEEAMAFYDGAIEDVLPQVRQAGGSSGGARPKAFIGFNPQTGKVCAESEELPDGYEHWMVKFNTTQDGASAGEREWRYYQAAISAGINMMPCRLIKTVAGDFFATKRFDRTERGGRLHLASAAGLLHANFRVPGDEYSVLFKLTDALTRDYASKKELFGRVALNVFAHNRDDHLKNFAFLMDENGRWTLSPFFDFTYASGPNGWHTLSVAGEGAEPKEDDLRRLATDVGLSGDDAEAILDKVKRSISHLGL